MSKAPIHCTGPVSRRGLIKSTMAASLGYVLGRNYIPAAWAADIAASYHWLDEHGNAIVWDGLRTALPGTIQPGSTRSVSGSRTEARASR